MAEIRKIIFIKNAVETLGYFSEQIARELERNGYETCFIDYERMYESMDVMLHFCTWEEDGDLSPLISSGCVGRLCFGRRADAVSGRRRTFPS